MNALGILDIQVNQVKLWRSSNGLKLAQIGIDRMIEDGTPDAGWWGPADAQVMADAMADWSDTATTYWVTSNMCDLLSHAIPSFEDQPIRRQDLPSPSGFLVLDKRIHITAVAQFRIGNGKVVPVEPSIIAWKIHHDELLVALYVHWTFMQDVGVWIDVNINEYELEHTRELYGDYVLTGYMKLEFDYVGKGIAAGDDDDALARRTLLALFTLMQQRIALVSGTKGTRSSQRNIDRARCSIDNEVLVIELRRPSQHTNEHSIEHEEVVWSHRWIVDGHWRWHWYPKEKIHKQIYIAPHIKGPEDRPLIIKDKVYKFRR